MVSAHGMAGDAGGVAGLMSEMSVGDAWVAVIAARSSR